MHLAISYYWCQGAPSTVFAVPTQQRRKADSLRPLKSPLKVIKRGKRCEAATCACTVEHSTAQGDNKATTRRQAGRHKKWGEHRAVAEKKVKDEEEEKHRIHCMPRYKL